MTPTMGSGKLDAPLVSIIIPTHNRFKFLVRLLDSLFLDNYKNKEIIIVNDCSFDETEDYISALVKKNKKIKLINNKKNIFTAASRNCGINCAKGKYLFFIDDDNVITEDLVSKLVSHMELHEEIGEIAPIMYYLSNPNIIFWAGTKRNMTTTYTQGITNIDNLNDLKLWPTEDIINAFMVRTDVLKRFNILFKEKLGIMYEESDFSYQIRKSGYLVQVANHTKIYHDIVYSSGGLLSNELFVHTMMSPKRTYYTARNRLVFHSWYSNAWELIGIVVFWNWLFCGFYIASVLFYRGSNSFSLKQRILLVKYYIKGVCDGLLYVLETRVLNSNTYQLKLLS